VAAGGVGAAGALFSRILADDQASFLDAQLARGGALLWVRTPDAAAERLALEVLRRYSEYCTSTISPTEGARAQAKYPRPGKIDDRTSK
jgi:hypothetical protein